MIVIYNFRAHRSQRGLRPGGSFPNRKKKIYFPHYRKPSTGAKPICVGDVYNDDIEDSFIWIEKVRVRMMMMMMFRKVVVVLGKNEGFGEKGQVLWKRWKR